VPVDRRTKIPSVGKESKERSADTLRKSHSPIGKASVVCGCFGTIHKPLTNCLYCGRISCEREGYDFCPFCGLLVEMLRVSKSKYIIDQRANAAQQVRFVLLLSTLTFCYQPYASDLTGLPPRTRHGNTRNFYCTAYCYSGRPSRLLQQSDIYVANTRGARRGI
jgi:hypothetical protein